MLSSTTSELKTALANHTSVRIIDVRSPEEFKVQSIPGAINIPTNQVPQNIDKFKADQPTYVICQSGTRSKLVVLALTARGIKNLYNVTGGMNQW